MPLTARDTPGPGVRPWLPALALLLLAGQATALDHPGYNRAVELAGAGQLRPALSLLDSLLAHNSLPADLVDNGHYWRGECLYGLGSWLDALLAFEHCLAEPGANKAEAAQLKIALCWTNQGRPERGCREANRLLERWPAGEHAAQARKLVQLTCGTDSAAPGSDPDGRAGGSR
jgi:TolA-binding protein